jgi:hypothetical protein
LQGRDLARCNNAVDLSAPGVSNGYSQAYVRARARSGRSGLTGALRARAQGAMVVYGLLVAMSWFGFLVLNTFLSVVFLNASLSQHSMWYHIVNWGWPLISVIIALAQHQYGFIGLITSARAPAASPARAPSPAPSPCARPHPACAVIVTNNGWWADGLLMIPLSLIVFPSTVLTMITLARIAAVGMRRNVSKSQVRPAAVAPRPAADARAPAPDPLPADAPAPVCPDRAVHLPDVLDPL